MESSSTTITGMTGAVRMMAAISLTASLHVGGKGAAAPNRPGCGYDQLDRDAAISSANRPWRGSARRSPNAEMVA